MPTNFQLRNVRWEWFVTLTYRQHFIKNYFGKQIVKPPKTVGVNLLNGVRFCQQITDFQDDLGTKNCWLVRSDRGSQSTKALHLHTIFLSPISNFELMLLKCQQLWSAYGMVWVRKCTDCGASDYVFSGYEMTRFGDEVVMSKQAQILTKQEHIYTVREQLLLNGLNPFQVHTKSLNGFVLTVSDGSFKEKVGTGRNETLGFRSSNSVLN